MHAGWYDAGESVSPIRNRLHALWLRGLLAYEPVMKYDDVRTPQYHMVIGFYYLLPTTRVYIENYLEQDREREVLLIKFGAVYANIASFLRMEINKDAIAATIARKSREDLERAKGYIPEGKRGYYLRNWGWLVYRLGNPYYGLQLLEQALEIAEEQHRLRLALLNDIAEICQATGRPQDALRLYEEALSQIQETGDRLSVATILNNIGLTYHDTGRPQEALRFYKEAL